MTTIQVWPPQIDLPRRSSPNNSSYVGSGWLMDKNSSQFSQKCCSIMTFLSTLDWRSSLTFQIKSSAVLRTDRGLSYRPCHAALSQYSVRSKSENSYCISLLFSACSSGALSFRPVIWTKSLNSSQPLILESRLKSKEFPDPHFSWSKSIQLNDIWSRVGVIEHEAANVEIAESKDPTLFVSGLPRFLPIEIIRCFPLPSGRTGSADFDRSSSNKMKDRSEDAFYMAVVTEWTTCVHRNRSTQQLTISVKPPFRIRSTVPMPIR